jgi:SH3-like domain-containing protein
MSGCRSFCAALLALLWLALPGIAHAAEKDLPLPRFVSLRVEKVNVRTGPGEQYPIEWVFTRKDLPVEIVQTFDNWRKIRDSDGSEGWVHQRMLAGRRSVLVRGTVRELHRQAEANAEVVARLEPGVVAKLVECQGPWCRVEAQGGAGKSVTGWLRRNEIWGVYPDEAVQ